MPTGSGSNRPLVLTLWRLRPEKIGLEVLVCLQSIQGRSVLVLQDLFVGEPWVDNPDLTDHGLDSTLAPSHQTRKPIHVNIVRGCKGTCLK